MQDMDAGSVYHGRESRSMGLVFFLGSDGSFTRVRIPRAGSVPADTAEAGMAQQ